MDMYIFSVLIFSINALAISMWFHVKDYHNTANSLMFVSGLGFGGILYHLTLNYGH